jgi:hypothetical protein
MKIRQEDILDGEMMPRWYAVAYRDDYRNVLHCYPVGIHLVVQLWEWLAWKIARAKHYSLMRRPMRGAYHAGFEDACREIDEERIRVILYGHLQSMKKDGRP